jgi:hypothetical protein
MTKNPTVKQLKKKADKALQEWGARNYHACLVCGGEYNCLHHYYPKSVSSTLRYDKDNLIPICIGCHFRHHHGTPEIQNQINKIKGSQWLENLEKKKQVLTHWNKGMLLSIVADFKNS